MVSIGELRTKSKIFKIVIEEGLVPVKEAMA
jgi:hypothetical protein